MIIMMITLKMMIMKIIMMMIIMRIETQKNHMKKSFAYTRVDFWNSVPTEII